jgi:protein-tyrosine phosphatase
MDIKRGSRFNVCFICSANICRSPYAEARMTQMIEEAGLDDVVSVTSAGTFGIEGERAHPRSIQIAQLRGASLREFRSRGVTNEIISASQLIVCMDARHLRELARDYPEATPRMRLLRASPNAIGGTDVPDPVGMVDAAYDACLAVIDDALAELLPKIRQAVRASTPTAT